ncbi:MAG: AAA family ATPase [Candidatus Freyarchaeota archaeon]
MNIQSVSLRNFRSYGDTEQVFDVSNYPMVVITGDNGSGKSSIIEAILFCLFGETSITKGRREMKMSELLNDKTNKDAVVSLTFELNGSIYRVERTLDRKRGTSGHARIIEVSSSSGPKAKQAVAPKEVTKSIESLVGMDYDSFTHSVVMTQGEFEALTEAKPAKRKELFMKMFGLTKYEQYLKEVINRQNKLNAEIENISGQIKILEADVEKESETRERLKEADKEFEKVKSEVEETERNKRRIEEDLNRASEHKKDYDNLLEKLASLREEINGRKSELESKNEEYREILRAEDELEKLQPKIKRYNELEPQLKELQEKEKQNLKLTENINKLEIVIKTKSETLQSEIERLTREREDSKRLLQENSDRVKSLEGEIAELGNPESEKLVLEENKKSLESKRDEVFRLSVEFETKISSINETLETLERTTEPKCPVCGGDLTEEKKEERVKHLESEKSRLEAEKSKVDKELRRLEKELESIGKEIKRREKASKDLAKKATELQNLQNRISELQKEIEEHENALKVKQEIFSEERFVEEEKKQIKQLEEQIKSLKYDRELHSKLEGEFEELKETPQEVAALGEKVSRKTKVVKEIENLKRMIKEKEELYEADEKRKNTLEGAARRWEELNKKFREIEEKLSELQTVKGEAKQRVENLNSILQEIKNKKEQLEKIRKEYNEKQILDKRLSILGEAFSKDGIPFRMLKKIVPLVAARSTELLHKLTESQLGLEVSMEQDKIYVKVLEAGKSNHVGRYSGGEKMRINFALRLAISELLTKMGGKAAKIESLMIDEGFGALDDDGRQAIINIFNLLEGSFKKIIAITHVKEVQEMFPVQFRVEKVGDFSRIIAP